jgi:hypothetical protein
MLCWHEIVNDVLGGVPIAVTYHALCDSAVVFDRQVRDERLDFGFSGLLYNSNLLLYDVRLQAEQESLWGQLLCRAVAGPAAAAERRLTVLPQAVVRWADWKERYPDTTVLAPQPAFKKRYKRDPYASYYGSDTLRFPVSPLPPATGPAKKTPLVVVFVEGVRAAYSVPEVARRADAQGLWRTELGGVPLRFTCQTNPPSVFVESEDPAVELRTIYTFWFGWYAMHPEDAGLVAD